MIQPVITLVLLIVFSASAYADVPVAVDAGTAGKSFDISGDALEPVPYKKLSLKGIIKE